MVRDLTFQALKLLSQYIVSSDKIPEGKILQKTSCMNQEDAELIGLLEGIKILRQLDPVKDKDELERLNRIEKFFEVLGMSRWIKGELTHLGFRAGTRYQESIDVAEDQEPASESVVEEIDEADISASSDKK